MCVCVCVCACVRACVCVCVRDFSKGEISTFKMRKKLSYITIEGYNSVI